MLLFSSTAFSTVPCETRAETAARLSVCRELLSGELKALAEFQPDLPARLGLLGAPAPTCQVPREQRGLRSPGLSWGRQAGRNTLPVPPCIRYSYSPFASRPAIPTGLCVCSGSTWSSKRG